MSCPPQPESEKLVPQILLTSMVAIGLRKPYAKTKVGEPCMMVIDLADGCFYRDQNTRNTFQDQNTEK